VKFKIRLIDSIFQDKFGFTKCVKCESSNRVGPYEFKRTTDYKSTGKNSFLITSTKVTVPVCDECRQEFEEWENNHSNRKNGILL